MCELGVFGMGNGVFLLNKEYRDGGGWYGENNEMGKGVLKGDV